MPNPKPVRDLTDAELCREGAEAMGWVLLGDGMYSDTNAGKVLTGDLLTDPAHGLPMLLRIREIACSRTASYAAERAMGYDEPMRVILQELVEAYRSKGGDDGSK